MSSSIDGRIDSKDVIPPFFPTLRAPAHAQLLHRRVANAYAVAGGVREGDAPKSVTRDAQPGQCRDRIGDARHARGVSDLIPGHSTQENPCNGKHCRGRANTSRGARI